MPSQSVKTIARGGVIGGCVGRWVCGWLAVAGLRSVAAVAKDQGWG